MERPRSSLFLPILLIVCLVGTSLLIYPVLGVRFYVFLYFLFSLVLAVTSTPSKHPFLRVLSAYLWPFFWLPYVPLLLIYILIQMGRFFLHSAFFLAYRCGVEITINAVQFSTPEYAIIVQLPGGKNAHL
jgi:hypothetical protein